MAYRLMDPKTHEIFTERNVHFEESSLSLSFNPLRTSYIVETDSATNDSDSMNLEICGILLIDAEQGHNINTFHMHTSLQ